MQPVQTNKMVLERGRLAGDALLATTVGEPKFLLPIEARFAREFSANQRVRSPAQPFGARLLISASAS